MAIFSYIAGIAGTELNERERKLFASRPPWGVILFKRNVADPEQLQTLVQDIRTCLQRVDAPILIDQEGGRVQRMGPPHWPAYPPASVLADLYLDDPEAALRAAWLSGRLLGEDLHAVGINVDCLPVADVRFSITHSVIGDRAYGDTVDQVVELASAATKGLCAAGVSPVLKHIPGHGRAMADSHLELPVVACEHAELSGTDFAVFHAFRDLPMAMTAHVVFNDIDPALPATISPKMISEVIRGEIGFEGLLMTDDLSMHALRGPFDERTANALDAGCDMALHCNGDIDEMCAVAAGAHVLRGQAAARADAALDAAKRITCDIEAARDEFASLIAQAGS